MVAEPTQWVDVEGAIRSWSRDELPDLDRRVFFAFSDGAPVPQVVLTRIGGVDEAALIQFAVHGTSKAEAMATAVDLATAIDHLATYEVDGVLLHGAAVEQVRWLPDPESGSPRYLLDALFTATAAAHPS